MGSTKTQMIEAKIKTNIGLSSMAVWIYMEGNRADPIRGWADADCNVGYGTTESNITQEEHSEKGGFYRYLEYSDKHVVVLRTGWNEFTDEKWYGEIETHPYYPDLVRSALKKPNFIQRH